MTNLVVAMPAEARPLIEFFHLRPCGSPSALNVFAGDGVQLAISGVGARAARQAVERLSLRSGAGEGRSWVNIGVAGHGDHEVGHAFLAEKIEDAVTGRSWSPHIDFPHGLPSGVVRTVRRPENRYDEDVFYDMEAAAFYESAIRVSARNRVQVLKIVSDNIRRPVETVTAEVVSRLVRQHLPALERVLTELDRLRAAG